MEKIREKYELGRRLDKGVILCRDKLTLQVSAVKIIFIEQSLDIAKRAQRELKIHQDVEHVNIIRYHEGWSEVDKLYIVMEYISSRDLGCQLQYNGPFPVEITKNLVSQIIIGVKYLHSKLIVHRDIKPQNLLVNEKNILKIIDFGLSTYLLNGRKSCRLCGTLEYIAPELCHSEIIPYDFAVDIWAIGISIYELLVGETPFDDHTTNEVKHNIINKEVTFPSKFNEEMRFAVDKCLQKNMNERVSLEELDALFAI